MTKKEKFINFIQKEIFDNDDIYIEQFSININDWEDIVSFWKDFISNKKSSNGEMTENGIKILDYMQQNENKYNNLFKAKEIGEGLFMSSRSVSGSMRKLITDGFVEKVGSDPVVYGLTDSGRTKELK